MEFVGPFRFQLPPEQCAWINAALSVVPRRFRPAMDDALLPPTDEDRRKVYYVPPIEGAVIATDPSEAVAGYKLPRLLAERFHIIEERPVGGGLIS